MQVSEFEIANHSASTRDIEAERKVFDEMKKHKESIESSRDKKEELSSDTKKAMQELFREMDRITSKINEVVSSGCGSGRFKYFALNTVLGRGNGAQI